MIDLLAWTWPGRRRPCRTTCSGHPSPDQVRAARDLRLRLRVVTATMERTQDEILAEALAGWLDPHHSEQ